jgi:hypothetical protein
MKLQDLEGQDLTEYEANKHILLLAWAWCDHADKSTEFMLQYMADLTELDYDEVVDFIASISEEERQDWYEKFPTWLTDMQEIIEHG